MQSLLTISKARRARLEAGKTLLQVQLESGVSASKLSAAERGLLLLTRAERRAVARVIGADSDWLFADGGTMRTS